MNHQGELEKKKYRNWVRGGLAYKYLKEGIEGFADDVVQQEHTRILSTVSQTPGFACKQCCLQTLRPIHKSEIDPITGEKKCYWGQSNCNCIYPKKRPCHFKVCDRILEDILKCHGSTPPTPNWKNTNIQKWCTEPWEIAKCFINAPGYSDKTKAADFDTPGLLHVFMNNVNLQSHISDNINGSYTFRKILQRRNELFHSSTMELEDKKLLECIDDIIAILEDEKELKVRNDAQHAVFKLRQLKQKSFIITTHDEVEVCRDALVSVTKKSEELKQTIRDGKADIVKKQKEATDAIDDATEYIGKKQTEVTDAIQDAKYDFDKKQKEVTDSIRDVKDDISKNQREAVDAIQCAKNDISKKQKEVIDAIEDAKTDINEKQKEATEAVTDITQKAVLDALQEMDKQSLNKRVGLLESDISTSKQRLSLLESKVDILDNVRHNHQKQLDYVERKQVLQKGLVTMYQNYYVRTSISPLKTQDNILNVAEVYVSPEMVVKEIAKNESLHTEAKPDKPNTRTIQHYRKIIQTNGQKHKRTYIIGDVGTGKSTFCKMMIQNWCSANETPRKSDFRYENDDQCSAENDENVNEMRNFDFLFFVPLQRMSGIDDITEMIKAIITAADLESTDLIDKIFEQESERCLIVADGLDEWTPPKDASVLKHVSYGLPNRGKAKHAILITLSRPSAKGLLNMKSSEYDQKVELLGINEKSITDFIEIYLSKFQKTDLSYNAFMVKINTAKLKHLEKTPLLLQQLVWLYCTGNDIGKSVSDTYCHILNIMLGWSQKRYMGKDLDGDQTGVTKQDEHMQLPKLLQKFPRCEANKRLLLPLAKVAFEALTSETESSTFGRSHLRQRGVPNEGITTLIMFGILVENNCFDPTKENTQIEFMHISYLEFFAAVHVSSHYNEIQRSTLPNTILQGLYQIYKSVAEFFGAVYVSSHHNTILQDLFQKCKSATDVLQLSNVLKMICGLSPFLLLELSKSVSDIVSRDESINRLGNPHSTYDRIWSCGESHQIQHLILDCLSECDSNAQLMISLCDVFIYSFTDVSFLQRIIPDNVISLDASNFSKVKIWPWIALLKHLQYLHISNPRRLLHFEMELLSSLIQKAPLKYLSLHSVSCNCKRDHPIYLSDNDQLQKLDLRNCSRVIILDINTEHLEMVRFDSSRTLDIDLLLHARNLTELHIGNFTAECCKYDRKLDSVVQTLQNLRELKLKGVSIADEALMITPRMRNLKHIELQDVRMSLQTWYRFVSGLLTLQQSVQVDTTGYYIWTNIIKEGGRDYVARNTMKFEVIKDEIYCFQFRSKE